MSIGSVLRRCRVEAGLSVAAAAALGQVSRSGLSMVEAGRRSPNPAVLARLTRALGVQPDVWVPVYLQGEPRCQRLVDVARVLVEAGEYEAARLVLSRAFFMSRHTGDGRHNADIYQLLGRVRLALGHYGRALRWFKLFERAVRHGSDERMQAIATFNVALCMGQVGQEFEAAARFSEVIKQFGRQQLKRELGWAWLAKANVLLKRRSHKEAQQAYRSAAHYLRGQEFHGDAMLGLAITSHALEGAEASMPLYRKLLRRYPNNHLLCAKARVNLAVALRDLGLFEDAVREVDTALTDRAMLPTSLVASLLTEAALLRALGRDFASAIYALAEYKNLVGERDGQDIAVMRILAQALGTVPPQEELPGIVGDEHEHRLKDALGILYGEVAGDG